MKKVGLLAVIFFLASLSLISAAENETGVSLAYQCLSDAIEAKSTDTLSFQEAVFGILALGNQDDLVERVDDEEGSDCWPKSSCRLKDTAQVLLAYDRINKNTEDIEDYLISKNGTPTEITWFVMTDISNHVSSSCTVSYEDDDYTFTIGEDMKLSGNPGPCLAIIDSGYWLQVASTCVDATFDISCNQDFVTTLLYQKSGLDTIYVSSETHSAASSGTTSEEITARCLKQGSACNYEGTLWGALALQQAGHDISAYVPYLSALAPEHQNLLPSSFIFKLTGADDHYSMLVQDQKQNKFWEAPSTPFNKFYDTALALLALQGRESQEAENARSYLLSVQTPEGCWNNDNIRDTAFLLYAAFPDATVPSGSSGGASVEQCIGASPSYSCSSVIECSEAGGQTLPNYFCSGSLKCCSVTPPKQSCSALQGEVCAFDEICSESTVSSLEGSCCLGSCVPETSSLNACEQIGGLCATSCDPDFEDESADQCSSITQVCCLAKEEQQSSGSIWIWIIVLILLIALVALGIIYRKKLMLWYHKFRLERGKTSARRPPFPPQTLPQRPQAYSPGRFVPTRKVSSHLDKEMEETLRKLRDISK